MKDTLNLIDDDELFVHQVQDGVKIYYKRPPGNYRRKVTEKHTNNRGVTNFEAVGFDLLCFSIEEWEGITRNGDPVEPSRNNIDRLPPAVMADLLEKINATEQQLAKEADAEKN